MNVKCDECGSLSIRGEYVYPPKPEPKTMTEWMEPPKFPGMTVEIRWPKYVLTCLDCGFSVEYKKRLSVSRKV